MQHYALPQSGRPMHLHESVNRTVKSFCCLQEFQRRRAADQLALGSKDRKRRRRELHLDRQIMPCGPLAGVRELYDRLCDICFACLKSRCKNISIEIHIVFKDERCIKLIRHNALPDRTMAEEAANLRG